MELIKAKTTSAVMPAISKPIADPEPLTVSPDSEQRSESNLETLLGLGTPLAVQDSLQGKVSHCLVVGTEDLAKELVEAARNRPISFGYVTVASQAVETFEQQFNTDDNYALIYVDMDSIGNGESSSGDIASAGNPYARSA